MRIGSIIVTRSKNVDPSQRLAIARSEILANCDFIVDIGANDGQWISAVRISNNKTSALCLEPLPKNFKRLTSRGLENVDFLNFAVGNRNGVATINEASNSGLSSSILPMGPAHKNAAPHVKISRKLEIKIAKLSKILEDYNYKKMFIKIDTQGYELDILKSINSATWKKVYAFEIEVNLIATYKNCGLIEEVISLLRSKGFHPYRVEPGFGMPNFGQQLQMDILFIK
jgi:FkbM family methyltransferase